MHGTLKPLGLAEGWHALHTDAGHMALTSVIEAHEKCGGRLVSNDKVWILARPVFAFWNDEAMCDPSKALPLGDPNANAWHVWLAAGDLREAWKHFEPLPFLTYHRRDRLIVRRFNTMFGKFL